MKSRIVFDQCWHIRFDPIDTGSKLEEIFKFHRKFTICTERKRLFRSWKIFPAQLEKRRRRGRRWRKKKRFIKRVLSFSLSLSPQFYPSESLSQSLYRFPRIKLVLIVSRRASYFRPREHHPSVEIKRATSSSRMPNRQKRYLFHPPSTVISHREHLLVKMEFSYSQRDPIRSWTDGRANGMRDTRSSEIRFLDTLDRVSIFVQSFLLEIIDQASNIVSNDNEWWLEDRQQRGVCVFPQLCFKATTWTVSLSHSGARIRAPLWSTNKRELWLGNAPLCSINLFLVPWKKPYFTKNNG